MKSTVIFEQGEHRWIAIGRDSEKSSHVVDTNQIPPEQALSILEKVDSSDFFCLPHELSGGMESMSGADHLSYKVTVEVAGVQHTVETSDEYAPQALQPLLDELSYLARTTAAPSLPRFRPTR